MAGGDEPGVFDQSGVRVERENVKEADAGGPGGLEVHEGHRAGVEFGLGRVQFESAEDLVPGRLVVFGRTAVEDPVGGEAPSIREVQDGIVGVILDGSDGSAADEFRPGAGAEFFHREVMKLVGGYPHVRRTGGRRGGRACRGVPDGPVMPAVGDGGVERRFVELPVAPSPVADGFTARVYQHHAWWMGQGGEADREAEGGETCAGEGDVIRSAVPRHFHKCAPTSPSNWLCSVGSCGGTGAVHGAVARKVPATKLALRHAGTATRSALRAGPWRRSSPPISR